MQDDASPSYLAHRPLLRAGTRPRWTFEEREVVCDYDEDWYTFNLSRTQNLRVDLIFSDADGDIDGTLYDSNFTVLDDGFSVSDHEELIFDNAPSGQYYVKVYGSGGAQNSYRIFYSTGNLQTSRINRTTDSDLVDASGDTPGVFTTEVLRFPDVSQGSIVRTFRINQLDINHDCLTQLRVTLNWDGFPVMTLWNLQGSNCDDGGEDDDSLLDFDFFAGKDIYFSDREYPEFAGFDAQGELTLTIEDLITGESGELVDFDIEIDYYLP